MAKKKAKTKKAVKRAPKRAAPKLEIRVLLKYDGLKLYRLTYGRLKCYAAGCHCFTEKQAVHYWNPETHYDPTKSEAVRKAIKSVGKKIGLKAFKSDGDRWGELPTAMHRAVYGSSN